MRKSIALLVLLGLTSASVVACGGGDAEVEAEDDAIEAPANQNAPVAAPDDDGGVEDDEDEDDEDGEDEG